MAAVASSTNGAAGSRTGGGPAAAPARPPRVTARQIEQQFDDNLEAIDILKKSGPVGIFFLVAYIFIDWRLSHGTNALLVSPYHWLALTTVLLFFGLTWLRVFRAHSRGLSLLTCIVMIILIIRISAVTKEG